MNATDAAGGFRRPVEFDPFSQEFFDGAYDTYRRLRDEAPVYYSAKWDFWALDPI